MTILEQVELAARRAEEKLRNAGDAEGARVCRQMADEIFRIYRELEGRELEGRREE